MTADVNKIYKLSEFAELAGVSTKSLQRWDKNGVLVADRTDGYHRSYTQRHLDLLNQLRAENSSKLSRKKNFRFEDLTGKRFGRLLVLKRAEDWVGANGHRHIQWLCQCDCGNQVVVKGASLQAGYNKSCGCSRYGDSETKRMWAEYQQLKQIGLSMNKSGQRPGRQRGVTGNDTHFQDLTGCIFGCWHVIERAETRKYGKGQAVCWKCQCVCGTIKSVPGRDLKSGASQSCGCMSKISWLEQFTKQYLDEHCVQYEYQKSYPDLLGTGGKPLSYDFAIYHGDKLVGLIECQGEQHYRPIKKFGGAKKLLVQQIHDKLKANYADVVLGVPLFEVLYTAMSVEDVYAVLDNLNILNL